MKARLILGCHGRMEFGFQMCAGTKNVILDLSEYPEDSNPNLYQYLDNHNKLFDFLCKDTNKVVNVINFLFSGDYIQKHICDSLREYVVAHKRCGLYLYVEVE
jgi:translation initiation factor 2 beta subunit (eIF-2beta)/eIF-5